MSSAEKVKEIVEKSKHSGIALEHLPAIKSRQEFRMQPKRFYFISVISVISILVWLNFDLFRTRDCLVAMPSALSHAFRRPEDCNFCQNVTEIVRLSNTSPEDFERDFAYNARPVIVTDATVNWTALEVFSFWYFKELYSDADAEDDRWNCQFFPYRTEFKSLREALNIPRDRVEYALGQRPWYFGWSNCNYEVARELRRHYGRPYFLPRTSENNAIDWIFIGGSGLGAHMHVDNVRLPSWQAQIKGTKKWFFAPPPECLYECSSFSTDVQTGEIIVLDTNKWYHKTIVSSKDISITIGAEYD